MRKIIAMLVSILLVLFYVSGFAGEQQFATKAILQKASWAVELEGKDACSMMEYNHYEYVFDGEQHLYRHNLTKASEWEEVGLPHTSYVFKVEKMGEHIYALTQRDGIFELSSDGSDWRHLDSSPRDPYDATSIGSSLFVEAQSSPGNTVVFKWDGSSWLDIGPGYPFVVSLISSAGNDLYAFGYDVSAPRLNALQLRKWSGSEWKQVECQFLPQNDINLLTSDGQNLFAGTTNGLFKLTDSGWIYLGPKKKENEEVAAILATKESLYIGISKFDPVEKRMTVKIYTLIGSVWVQIGPDISADREHGPCLFLRFVRLFAGNLYVGTSQGLYKLVDANLGNIVENNREAKHKPK